MAQGIPIINWGEDFFNVNGTITQNNIPIKINIQVGQENATNIELNGSPVYVKRIDCGYAPNNSAKTIDYGLIDITFVKIEGVAYSSNPVRIYPIPFAYADSDRISVWIDENGLRVQSWGNKSEYHVYVDLYYTKN